MTKSAQLIYFSPTGTTRNISVSIAEGLGAETITHYDVTRPDATLATVLNDGVAIIGIPVYAGRVPELCLQRFQAITAKGVPAVLVALYGNRAFEDALVELAELAGRQGFQVIAAGAFIGEHSYSTAESPIAAGRPDAEDLKMAVQFGRQVAEKIERQAFDRPEIPGNIPYKARVQFGGVAPRTNNEICTLCGKCRSVCPPGVITLAGSVVTDADNCIMCCACVRVCDEEARSFNHPRVNEKRNLLLTNCSQAKAPEVFL